MIYVPPFSVVKERLGVNGPPPKARVNVAYADFVAVLKLILRGVQVDEAWYLSAYPDVAEAVQSGAYQSARQHFIEEGYFEGRRPCKLEVDEDWYQKKYPDIADGVKAGTIPSAADHFAAHGYIEGRLPSEY